MYPNTVLVHIEHTLSSKQMIIIKFECKLEPYNIHQGEALPIALYSDDEIIFAENEDNEELKRFIIKLIGVSTLNFLQEKALLKAADHRLQL